MAVDTSFLAAFATQPLSLIILGVMILFGIWMWKGMPKIITKTHESLKLSMSAIQKDVSQIQIDISQLKKSDCWQNKTIRSIQIDGLKIFLKNEDIPLSERYFGYFRYIDAGANGAIKKFVEDDLSKRDPILFESIKKIYYNNKKEDE